MPKQPSLKATPYKLLYKCQELSLLKPRGRQRTDSTNILAAIRDLGRLECITETLRYALNAVAKVAPTWRRNSEADTSRKVAVQTITR